MRFELKFKYRENHEYFLRVYSAWHLEGKGTWEVDAYDLLDELSLSDTETESIKSAILNYLWLDLDKEDLESLIKYIKENYEIPSKDC